MPKAKSEVSLTDIEKSVIKALLAKGWRNQDILTLVNSHRSVPVNFGRISGIKKNAAQLPASDEEVDFYCIKKKSFDSRTGLNFFDDERLIRARESMILAVQIFNSGGLNFKTETFTMLANVAWTYLMHEYYTRKNVIIEEGGKTVALSEMLKRPDCPLSEGMRQNLNALKLLRDQVEHKLLGKADQKWMGIFQACCFNFDKALCDLFGKHLSLASDLSLALQFGKMNMDQALAGNKYEVPESMLAIDASLTAGMTDEQQANLEFQFRVVYSLESSSKAKAHMHFVGPKPQEGVEVNNVMIKKVPADELFPHKAKTVVKLVRAKTGTNFTINTMIEVAKAKKVRPYPSGASPEKTDKQFCNYNKAHNDYTYNDAWVEFLVEKFKLKPIVVKPVVDLSDMAVPECNEDIESILAPVAEPTAAEGSPPYE